MHNYNVANRFTTKTKLGNWYEESELDDHQFKEYLYQKEKGNNLTLNTTGKISFSNQPVQLSSKSQPLVGGSNIQLLSACTQGVLAFNINEAILGEQTYAVTSSKQTEPSFRNVLTVEHVNGGEDPVRFGDKIRLTSILGNKKLYLQSLHVSPMRSSKFSRQQQVSMTATLNCNSVWVFQKIQARQRFDSSGSQIAEGQAIVLKHASSGQWLATDNVKYINNFGVEFQVFGKSFLSTNKTQNLFAEKQGHRNIENPMRSQGIQNQWHIVRR